VSPGRDSGRASIRQPEKVACNTLPAIWPCLT
jgi:hypothetical protein